MLSCDKNSQPDISLDEAEQKHPESNPLATPSGSHLSANTTETNSQYPDLQSEKSTDILPNKAQKKFSESISLATSSTSHDTETEKNSQQRQLETENSTENSLNKSRLCLLEPKIRNMIKDHQIDGLNFIMTCVIDDGRGCLLAHAMGLGKTLQIISFCSIYLRDNPKTILILMPVNTIANCNKEFTNWLPSTNLKVKTLAQNIKSITKRLEVVSEWSKGGILLCSYEMFRSMTTNSTDNVHCNIRDLLFDADVVICDEGHRIRNFDTIMVTALHKVATKLRIVLTGYPLQNNLQEFWCILNFIEPDLLGTSSDFKNLFTIPIKHGQFIDSTSAQKQLMLYRTFVLTTMLTPYVHRRSESIIISQLPEKIEYTLVFRMTKLQEKLYQLVSAVIRNPISAFGLSCKICNDPNILHEYMNNKSDTDEADIEDTDIPKDPSLSSLYGSLRAVMSDYVPELINTSPKMIALFEIINSSLELDDKMLIFSQSLYTLDMIEKCLHEKLHWKRNQHYYRIDGSTTLMSRHNMIEKFNTGLNQKLFLFSTKSGCMGINLTSANRVIIFDASFNPSDDLQATARVYRYGQKKKVYIYRFVMDESLEKCIFLHQLNKQHMSDRVLDSTNHSPVLSWSQSSYTQYTQPLLSNLNSTAQGYSDNLIEKLLKSFPFLFSQNPIESAKQYEANEVALTKFEEGLARVDFSLASAFKDGGNAIDKFEESILSFRKSAEGLVTWLFGSEPKFQYVYKLCLLLAEVVVERLIMQTLPTSTDQNLIKITEAAYQHIYLLYCNQISPSSYSNDCKSFILKKVNDLINDGCDDIRDVLLQNKSKLVLLASTLKPKHKISLPDLIAVLGPLKENIHLERLSRTWYKATNE